MYTLDGQAVGGTANPRTFLNQAIDRAGEQGLRVEAAFEYEFYLCAAGWKMAASSRPSDSLCFSSDGMDRCASAVIRRDSRRARAARTRAAPTAPAGAGAARSKSYTIQHAPVLEAADRQIAVRETVRAIALRNTAWLRPLRPSRSSTTPATGVTST